MPTLHSASCAASFTRPRRLLRPLVGSTLGLLWTTLLACSASPDAAGTGPGGSPGAGNSPTGALLGRWSGVFKNKASEGSASLRETNAEAEFKETGETGGTFQIQLPLLEKVYVKGTYRDFAQRSLMLTIKESTLSTFGMAGTTTDLPYELVGDTLELQNDRITLKLARAQATKDQGEGSASGQGGEGTNLDQPQGLLGHWRCDDARGLRWHLHLKTNQYFAADIFDPSGNRASLRLDGTTQPEGGDGRAAVLTVTTTDVTKYLGMVLLVKLAESGALQLTRSGESAETMSCSRTK